MRGRQTAASKSRRSHHLRFEPLEPRLVLDGTPMISELMAINDNVLQDGDGQYSDWLEIHNPTNETVVLTGWTLRDDNDSWQFPDDFQLGPGEYEVIFCSDGRETVPEPKDPYFDGTYYHTNFKLAGSGEYLGLFNNSGVVVHQYDEYPQQFENISYGIAQDVETTEFVGSGDTARYFVATGDPGAWTGTTFNDGTWDTGNTGIGYADLLPGFAVRNYRQSGTGITDVNVALQVVGNPANEIGAENSALINYYTSGGHGHYTVAEPDFPGFTGGDQNDFAIDATALVTIPAAGSWSFGVNSDDGFQLTITGATTSTVANSSTPAGSDTIAYAGLRGNQDTFGVFEFAQAGTYDLRLVFFEHGGGSSVEVFAAQGAHTSFNAAFDLVGDTGNGGLEVESELVTGGGGAEPPSRA